MTERGEEREKREKRENEVALLFFHQSDKAAAAARPMVRAWVMAVGLAALASTRPPAPSLDAELRRLRTLAKALGSSAPQPRELRHKPYADRLRDAASAERTLGYVELANGTWAVDAGLVTLGCTRRKTCFVGLLGDWWRLPSWSREGDVYGLVAAHGAAALLHSQDIAAFYRHFAPRVSRPHTLFTSIFATSGLFEALWICSSLLSIGGDLQIALGRGGFAALYIGSGLLISLCALYSSSATPGHGGLVAALVVHTRMFPRLRRSIMGVEMGAWSALAAQLGLASLPAFRGAPRPLLLLGLTALVPATFGWMAYSASVWAGVTRRA